MMEITQTQKDVIPLVSDLSQDIIADYLLSMNRLQTYATSYVGMD